MYHPVQQLATDFLKAVNVHICHGIVVWLQWGML